MNILFYSGLTCIIIGILFCGAGVKESLDKKMENKTGFELSTCNISFDNMYQNGKKLKSIRVVLAGNPELEGEEK